MSCVGVRAFSASVMSAAFVVAQLPSASAAPPPIFLQNSTITGFADTLTITRLPVKDGTGKVTQYDVTVQLKADGAGQLSAGAITQNPSQKLPTANLRPGIYARSDDPNSTLVLSGPFPAGGGGVASYTIVTKQGSPCGSPATVYTGTLASNPLQPRLSNAKITDTEYSYGVIGGGNVCNNPWDSNYIVGVAQRGTQIEIAAFTTCCTTDHSTPVARFIYNKQ